MLSNKYFGSKRQQGHRPRRGFTLTELIMTAAISGIIVLAVSIMIITSYRTYGSEMRQNEVNVRCRQMVTLFSADATIASQIGYFGAGPYTTPAADGSTTIPASTRIIVFLLPAYDASGTIPGAYDYVAYSWNQSKQTVLRTCAIYNLTASGGTKSLRTASTPTVVPQGGNYDASLSYQLHVASSSSSTYADSWVDPFTQSTLFTGSPASIKLQDVDEISMDVDILAKSWNQTVQQDVKSDTRFRNWRQS
jgi:prepilin-type N-terminal cleavage/methylation domain-containing protein